MADPFEYDVFLSFSSADEEIVKPIWQELCSNGLRVFWSNATLKNEVGDSWFDAIEKSLERSKHMLLICSENGMSSKWVIREYRAFFDYCHTPGLRRLIPLMTRGFTTGKLPLFLRGLQGVNIDDPRFIQELIPLLGGVDVDGLQKENQQLQEQVSTLHVDIQYLREQNASLKKENGEQGSTVERMQNAQARLSQENKAAEEKASRLLADNERLSAQIAVLNNKVEEASKRESRRPVENVDKEALFTAGEAAKQMTPNAGKVESDKKMRTLFVDNLPSLTVGAELRTLFSDAGTVISSRVSKGSSRGFGFVEMASEKEARTAITLFHGRDYSGHKLTVRIALPEDWVRIY